MPTLSQLAKKLDKYSLLGFSLWDFSLHSLGYEYGKMFLREVMLKYPLRTLGGLHRYNRMIRKGETQGEIVGLTQRGLPDLARRMADRRDKSLVGVGYCQKPLDADTHGGCPSGRFNHNCLFLEGVNLTDKKQPLPGRACRRCSIKTIGLQSLKSGLTLYIMTSATDVAQDILIPSLKRQKYRHGLFFLCPYSSEPFIFSLLICRIEACLFRYQSGNCEDYAQFIAADNGNKPKQTKISSVSWDWWGKFNQQIEQHPKSASYTHFSFRGNVLVPEKG